LRWNTPAEGTDSLKNYLESISDRKVNVTRLVIGKYGEVQYTIQFVFNPGQTPPGSGDVSLLVVEQQPATDGVTYAPDVYESVKGSDGIAGYFTVDLNSPFGPRNVSFNETADRLKRKLEEFTTIGEVAVHRFEYPDPAAGGWGDVKISTGTVGGYEWRIYFIKNTGSSDGFSFPPGSGNINPLAVSYELGKTIFGSKVRATSVTYVDGSNPIDGSFFVTYNGSESCTIRYDQQPLAAKYLLESLDTIGEVSVDGKYRFMERIDGLVVRSSRDSNLLTVEYDSYDAVNPPDVRQKIAPGDLIRVGGSDASDINSQVSIDGAEVLMQGIVAPESPIVDMDASVYSTLLPDEIVRIGADDYLVKKTGIEVQVVSIDCATRTGACGGFYLTLDHD